MNWNEVWRYRQSLFWLVYREVHIRYRNAVLGVLWAILQPLLSVCLIAGVFHQAAQIEGSPITYSLFTACGIVPWLYFSKTVLASAQSYFSYVEVLKKNYVPKLIIPLAYVFAGTVDLIIGLMILVFLCAPFSLWHLAWLILPTLWLMVLCFSLGLLLACLQVRFRDVAYATGFALQGLFFVSPILYSTENIIKTLGAWTYYNPLVAIMELYRVALITGAPVLDSQGLLQSALVTAGIFLLAVYAFQTVEGTLVERL